MGERATGTAQIRNASISRRVSGREASRPRTRIARVEVAYLRVSGGARAASSRRPRCQWYRGNGTFKTEIPAARQPCIKPVWLRARGTIRWSYRPRRRLPAGRYVVYSRAVASTGQPEDAIGQKSGNRRNVRIR